MTALFVFGLCLLYSHFCQANPIIMDLQRMASTLKESEFVTITQHTEVVRRKRDAVDHVEFPSTMDFTIHFRDQEIHIHLKRNVYMTSDIQLSDEVQPIEHDLGRKSAIYQDLLTWSAFVVMCEDYAEHCVLRGSLEIDGSYWTITPEGDGTTIHKAEQTSHSPDLQFGSGINPTQPEFSQQPDQDIQPQDTSDQKSRSKRAIPAECEIVECFAILDESVWEFHLSISGNNETAATESITAYYLSLYAQADLHYDFVSVRRPGSCIRLYLSGIQIQKSRDASWSARNEIQSSGAVLAFVDGNGGLTTCCQQGNDLRANYSIDLTQCFTWKDVVYKNMAKERSIGYVATACRSDYVLFQCGIIETYGDKVELLIAHEVGHGIGSMSDSLNDCSNDKFYIMDADNKIPDDPLKQTLPWYFSTCSLGEVYDHLAQYPECLKNNSFNDSEYDAFRNQSLAGTLYTWDEQCVLRSGNVSMRCDPEGQNRTFLPDMCGSGIYCTDARNTENCIQLTRPMDGTPCGDNNAYCVKGECFLSTDRSIQLGGTCQSHIECMDLNSFCCPTTLTCICDPAFYDNNGGNETVGTCQPKVTVGVECNVTEECLDPNAVCSWTCICTSDYYTSNGTCIPKKPLGGSCSTAEECATTSSACEGSECVCPTGSFVNSNFSCEQSKVLGEACAPGECLDPKAVCDPQTSTCFCGNNYFNKDGVCTAKVTVGVECNVTEECLDPNAVCSGTCICASDYYTSNGTCIPKKPLGGSCSTAEECATTSSACEGSECVCPTGSFVNSNFSCEQSKVLGEACAPGECLDPKAVCDPQTSTCFCGNNYFNKDGVCTAIPLDGLCLFSQQCDQYPKSICKRKLILKRCKCNKKNGYIEVNGKCEQTHT